MLNKDLSFEESFDREIRLQCLSTDISNLPTARQILTDGLHAWSPAPSKPTFPPFGSGGLVQSVGSQCWWSGVSGKGLVTFPLTLTPSFASAAGCPVWSVQPKLFFFSPHKLSFLGLPWISFPFSTQPPSTLNLNFEAVVGVSVGMLVSQRL